MPKTPLWTPEDDAELMAAYAVKSNLDLAIYFDRSENAIKQRAMTLGITSHQLDDANELTNTAEASNRAFIIAMARAIRSGRERPPMIGMDKRPCTKAPRDIFA